MVVLDCENSSSCFHMSNSNKFEPVWARASPEPVRTCLDRAIKQEFSILAFSLKRTTLEVGPLKTSATKAKNVDDNANDDNNANNNNNVNDASDDDDANDVIIVAVGVSGVIDFLLWPDLFGGLYKTEQNSECHTCLYMYNSNKFEPVWTRASP